MSRGRSLLAAGAAGSLAGLVLGGPGAAAVGASSASSSSRSAPVAALAEGAPCDGVQPDTQMDPVASPSTPLVRMRVEQAHRLLARRSVEPGEGVVVAVVDSGIVPAGVRVVGGVDLTSPAVGVVDEHGTVVANLVAGAPGPDGDPVGAAPAAQVVDVRVYDSDDTETTGGVQLTTAGVVEGLEWVAAHARRLGIGVVNVSHAVPESPALEQVVRRLWRDLDVVVVAASGNRPQDPPPPFLADHVLTEDGQVPPGEDVAGLVHPAGLLEHVVAVSATADGSGEPDASRLVLQSSAIDVAAPTFGAVARTLNGVTCLLPDVATSWAAAEVSGVVALLRSAYPDETNRQVVARLLQTAGGVTEPRSVLTGAGVVQPVEALTRPLHPDRQGRLSRTTPASDDAPATAPEPPADLLPGTRARAVWWGVLGGGAVVLALVLRPLLSRRRG